MATPSEVKAGLDDAAHSIRTARQNLKNAKAAVTTAKNQLTEIPTTFAGLITTINAYDAGDGAFEALAKSELARLSAEFDALETKAGTAQTALSSIDFAT